MHSHWRRRQWDRSHERPGDLWWFDECNCSASVYGKRSDEAGRNRSHHLILGEPTVPAHQDADDYVLILLGQRDITCSECGQMS